MNTDTIDFPTITDAPRAEVATIPAATLKDTALASFVPIEQHMRTLAARYSNVAFDVTTPKGMKEAKAARMVLRDEGRYAVQRLQKRLKDEANDLKRMLDSKADELIAITKPVEDAIDVQITVEEERKEAELRERARIERERVAAMDQRLLGMGVWIERCKAPGMTAERIASGIKMLQDAPLGDDWADFSDRAIMRKAEVLVVMRDLHAAAVAREAEAARLEAQRLENERVAAEQKAEAERLAAERRALAEEAAALAAARAESERLLRLAEERRAALIAEETKSAQACAEAPTAAVAVADPPDAGAGMAENPAPAVVPAEAAPLEPHEVWPDDDYIPPSSTVDEPQPQTEAEMAAADGPEVDLPPVFEDDLPDNESPFDAVMACLSDDAAKLRDENPEDEMAWNMDAAAELIGEMREMLQWAYGKLHVATYSKQEDALMLDRLKLLLEYGV